MSIGFGACGPPPAPTRPEHDLDRRAAVDCDTVLANGNALHDAGKYADAVAAYRAALPACEGHGFHSEIGYSLAALGKYDEAAGEYILELRGASPPRVAFGNLAAIVDKLSPARREEIARLGATKDAPIHVPDIGAEYTWVDRFGCPRGPAKRHGQSLVDHRGHQLDVLAYACADGAERMTYFDFSADPSTRQIHDELNQP